MTGAPSVNLTAGTRLGPYEITGLVGAGGMGEVYRAVDSRLGRAVAIKLLPPEFADDPDRLLRFHQEARATAALNHPGLLAVYDAGMHDRTPFMVSELLDGTTLRERLKEGPLPVATCIDYGRQLAEGLAAAHERGIVHRDLKPENIFELRDGRVKILDFGLARLTATGAVSSNNTSIGETCVHTLPHTIVGTVGYMSPEQTRGEPVDHRTDIFALGCVMFEMLEGRRLFAGATPADTISAILKDPPAEPESSPERPLPLAVKRIVHRCLQKDPDARFQSARDLAFALGKLTGVDDVPAAAAGLVSARRQTWRSPRRIAAGLVALAAAGVLPFFAARSWFGPDASRVTEFLIPAPRADLNFAPVGLPGLAPTAPQVGVSPDGRSIALVASAPDGRRTLWIRSLESSIPRPIVGSEGVNSWPFWSPDSRFVVVAIGRVLHKIDATSGTIERLCSLPVETPPTPFVTGSWENSGTILFSIGGPAGIYRIMAEGGTPEAVTTLDVARRDHYHGWPQLLANGRFLTFVRTDDVRTTGTYAGTVGERTLSLVLSNPSRGVYANGHLLWVSDERLVAQPIDTSDLRLSGQAATIAASVFQGAGRTAAFWVSNNGTVVYSVGDSPERQFRWLDRAGTARGDVGPPAMYVSFDLSPDGSRAVAEIARPGQVARSTLSTLDTTRGVITPLTSGELNDSDPRFGPGGHVVFARNSGESPGIFRADPAGGELSLLFPRAALPVIWMEAWAHDGRALVFRSGADRDAWRVSPAETPVPQRLTRASASVEQIQLSPDSRVMAYNSAESSRDEVYVSRVPYDGKRWQVSKDGGVQATWRADGRELYYLGLDGALNVVEVRRHGDGIELSPPRQLFRVALPVISSVVEQYRPTADGERFLFCVPLTSVQREPLRVVINWPARLAPDN